MNAGMSTLLHVFEYLAVHACALLVMKLHPRRLPLHYPNKILPLLTSSNETRSLPYRLPVVRSLSECVSHHCKNLVCWAMVRYHRANRRMESAQITLPARRSTGIGSRGGVVSPVAARLNRDITPTSSRSCRTASITPVTTSRLSRRLRATLLAMAEVVAISALDAAPIARFGTLAGRMTLLIAVAALHDTRLVTLTRHMTLITAVVTGTATTTSHRLTRLSAFSLAVSDRMLARCSKILDKNSTYPVSPQLKQA
jgi:hypothetical protein